MFDKKIPHPIMTLLVMFASRFPVPTGNPGDAHEENVRQWTIKFVQTVVARFPGQGYGLKRAEKGRPISKDSLVRKVGDFIGSWDLLLAAGSGVPQLAADPEFHDVSDQLFVLTDAVDHLAGGQQPGPSPTPQPTPAPAPSSSKGYEDTLETARQCEAAFAGINAEALAHLLYGYLFEGRSREDVVNEAKSRKG